MTKHSKEIPDDFSITAEMRQWADEKIRGVNLENETEKFCAYYRANAKKFVRWDQAWRNWLLKAVEFRSANRNFSKSIGDKRSDRRSNLAEAVLARKDR